MHWAETRRQLCLISRRVRMLRHRKNGQVARLVVSFSDWRILSRILPPFLRPQRHELSCVPSDDRDLGVVSIRQQHWDANQHRGWGVEMTSRISAAVSDGTQGCRGSTHLFRRIPHIRGVTGDFDVHFDIFGLVAQGEVAQLIPLVEHVIPNGEVDDSRQDCADPYREVVGIDAECVPVRADPAPQLGMAKTRLSVMRETG